VVQKHVLALAREVFDKVAFMNESRSGPAKIFISHMHEEAALADAVMRGLEDAFKGRLTAFVSSHIRDNPGGDEWLAKIKRELLDPNLTMLVALLSPEALAQPWISIELGAVWIQNKSVFPLCHSGQTLGALPRPMQDFGGADLTTEDAAARLIAAIERATGCDVPEQWPRKAFLGDLRKAAAQRTLPGAAVTLKPRAGAADLPDEEVKILQLLAVAQNHGEGEMVASEIARLCGIAPARLNYYADRLLSVGLVRVSYNMYEGKSYELSSKGSGWLMDHDQMPD
jgi:hypothetical protein